MIHSDVAASDGDYRQWRIVMDHAMRGEGFRFNGSIFRPFHIAGGGAEWPDPAFTFCYLDSIFTRILLLIPTTQIGMLI